MYSRSKGLVKEIILTKIITAIITKLNYTLQLV